MISWNACKVLVSITIIITIMGFLFPPPPLLRAPQRLLTSASEPEKKRKEKKRKEKKRKEKKRKEKKRKEKKREQNPFWRQFDDRLPEGCCLRG